MATSELERAIEETRQAIEASKTYLRFLATGQGLPTNDLARQELAESHTKLIEKMEKQKDELENELSKRTT